MTEHVHATCIAIGGRGVLLLGDSGSGKSDLALRLIDGGAMLVADDQVVVRADDATLSASAPERLKGKLEVRGVGIITLPFFTEVKLALAVRLVQRAEVERLPEDQFFSCLGCQVPLLSLHAFDHSTPAKIRMWLQRG